MLLASVSGIREELGYDDMTDINAAITMALHAAEPQLASLLNTSFAKTENEDTFWVPAPTVIDGPHVKTEFWLRRGLVVGTPLVTDILTDLSSAMVYDKDKGIARDWTTRYSYQKVSFRYQSGFDAQTDKPESYDLTQVPSWLQEAAKLQALIHLTDHPSITEAGIQIDAKTTALQLQALMVNHIRYAPMALYPL